MKILVGQTERGFSFGEFIDANGEPCSIQDSSAAEDYFLWLGRDEAGDKPARMHLTVERAAALIPMLARFVKTGTIQPRTRKKKLPPPDLTP